MNCSLVVLCIERIICICKIRSYEESTRPVLVGTLLIIVTVAFSVVFFLLLIPGVEWTKGVAVGTIRNANNTQNYQIMIVFVTISELSGMFAFLFIHHWCLRRRKNVRKFGSIMTLSSKFQIEETLNLTTLILPMVLVKGGMQVYSSFAQMVSYLIMENPRIDTQMIVFELISVTTIQSLTTSLILLYGTGQLKRFFCCAPIPSNRVASEINKDDQDLHFRRLNQLFEQGLAARKM
ncbi:serpentine type 7TM GPCR receptor class ab chemoreceptor domain-containing protein [Ditylenchus destructor]|nr:serpentine type 7TM GPCR receptor class ab chemoreceptor domain-containing protein [Ditylenchus destructor]